MFITSLINMSFTSNNCLFFGVTVMVRIVKIYSHRAVQVQIKFSELQSSCYYLNLVVRGQISQVIADASLVITH